MMRQLLNDRMSEPELDCLASVLLEGGVIAFPTDTFYGLGADPFNRAAVHRIYALKGRPEHRPILLLVDTLERAATVAAVSELARGVAEAFWPGPLTLILPSLESVPDEITAQTGTVGVRLPDARFAVQLIRHLGKPITATSANRSGAAPCISAEEVRNQFGEELPIIVDGGRLSATAPSTLLDLTAAVPTIRRRGAVSEEVLGGYFGGAVKCED